MPELPEVETMRSGLELLVCGRRITAIDVLVDRMVTPSVDELVKRVVHQKICAMRRRGKYLIFELEKDSLISHLRMEGKYLLFKEALPYNKHYHVFFKLDDGSTLVYQDVRKFGTLDLVNKADELLFFNRKKLGPEPIVEDFKLDKFMQQLLTSSKMIKTHLLDQTLVVGLGNIYVDEVLWYSKIHPEQIGKTLTKKQINLLHKNIIAVLALAVEKRGATIRTYQNAFGESGTMQHFLTVYGKTSLPCQRCQTVIEKIKIGGRGTHFCPKCQIM